MSEYCDDPVLCIEGDRCCALGRVYQISPSFRIARWFKKSQVKENSLTYIWLGRCLQWLSEENWDGHRVRKSDTYSDRCMWDAKNFARVGIARAREGMNRNYPKRAIIFTIKEENGCWCNNLIWISTLDCGWFPPPWSLWLACPISDDSQTVFHLARKQRVCFRCKGGNKDSEHMTILLCMSTKK